MPPHLHHINMSSDETILALRPLGFQWPTIDPFLFCVHHLDNYPRGKPNMGPAATLDGRNLGMDFDGIDGWRMYHGSEVPGFPQHPHRGFETITIARRGFIDHSDSMGATARFGAGDVQWMTAGRGIVHAEMFPLVSDVADNPVELFQIWLNLPRSNKLVEPHFSMMWNQNIPTVRSLDGHGRAVDVTIIGGSYDKVRAPSPPPHSWAADPNSDFALWTMHFAPGATVTIPATLATTLRSVAFFSGKTMRVCGTSVPPSMAVVRGEVDLVLENGDDAAEVLLLQARPLEEPVARHGPFVMNTAAEIRQAYDDYDRTRFGGWPWPSNEPVQPRPRGRFALHAGGRLDEPKT
jgi:quercetin 2,3-dioxygenase